MKMITHKALSLVLSLAMLFGMVQATGVTAFAAESGDVTAYYCDSGLFKDSNCTHIIDYNNMTFRSTITKAEIKVGTTAIEEMALANCTDLKSIEIPSSVKSIDGWAFDHCERLSDITFLGNSELDFIGKCAFQSCYCLKNISIPSSVQTITDEAFHICYGLTSVTITSNIKTISASSFLLCANLKNFYIIGDKIPDHLPLSQNTFLFKDNGSNYEMTNYYGNKSGIEIPTELYGKSINPAIDESKLKSSSITAYYNGSGLYKESTYSTLIDADDGYRNIISDINFFNGITTIGDYAFVGCTGLTSITIPESISSIGSAAFASSGLTSIELNSKLESIGKFAFRYCTGLTSLRIPDSVKTISDTAFADCENLTKLVVDSANLNYAAVDGVLYSHDKNTLKCFPGGKTGEYKIPLNVSSIGDYAFMGCTGLTGITIPNNVSSIGDFAFMGCTGLTGITIPNNVSSIGDSTFYNCTGLTGITIPNNVSSIGDSAFMSCTGLTGITIPNNVSSIGDFAFMGCTGLTGITIPNNVSSIGDSTFYNCTGLNYVVIKGTISTLGYSCFDKGQNGSGLLFYVPSEKKDDYTKMLLYSNVTGVTTAEIKTIPNVTAFEPLQGKTVPNGTALNDLELPKTLEATVDGTKKTVNDVIWTPDITYNPTIAGNHAFTAVLPSYYDVTTVLPKMTVTVAAKPANTHTILIDHDITGGSITASPTAAKVGDTISLTIIPNTGKQLVSGSLKYSCGGKNYNITSSSFIMTDSDVTITAQFETKPSDNGSSNHHNSNNSSGKNSAAPTSAADLSTGAAADLSGVTLPAGVTGINLNVTKKDTSGKSDQQAANFSRALLANPKSGVIGNPVVYNMELLDQNGSVTSGAGKIKITMPVPAGLRGTPHVLRYEQAEAFTDMGAKLENGMLVFETDRLGYFAAAGVGDSITLDTTNYIMPVNGNYEIGLRISGTRGTYVKVYSSNNKIANVTKLKNGNYRVNGAELGVAYIMYDVYDNKSKLLTHASVRVDVKTGIHPHGDSTRQIGIY
nr:leucine-rich repeat protein [uncultured Caproiciproducens sp.]